MHRHQRLDPGIEVDQATAGFVDRRDGGINKSVSSQP
jgi:hypothetical protein